MRKTKMLKEKKRAQEILLSVPFKAAVEVRTP